MTATRTADEEFKNLAFHLLTREIIEKSLQTINQALKQSKNPLPLLEKLKKVHEKTSFMIGLFKSSLKATRIDQSISDQLEITDSDRKNIPNAIKGIASFFELQLTNAEKMLPFISKDQPLYTDYLAVLLLETENISTFLFSEEIKAKLIQDKIIDEKIFTELREKRKKLNQSIETLKFPISEAEEKNPIPLKKWEKIISGNLSSLEINKKTLSDVTENIKDSIKKIKNLHQALNKTADLDQRIKQIKSLHNELKNLIVKFNELIISINNIKLVDPNREFEEITKANPSKENQNNLWDLLISKQKELTERIINIQLTDLEYAYIHLFESAEVLLKFLVKIFNIEHIEFIQLETLYSEINQLIELFQDNHFKLSNNTNGRIFSTSDYPKTKKNVIPLIPNKSQENVNCAKDDFDNAFDLFRGNERKIAIWEKILNDHKNKEKNPTPIKPITKKKKNKKKEMKNILSKTPETSKKEEDTSIQYIINQPDDLDETKNIMPEVLKIKEFIKAAEDFSSQIQANLIKIKGIVGIKGIIPKAALVQSETIISEFNQYQEKISALLIDPISNHSDQTLWTLFYSDSEDGFINTLDKPFFSAIIQLNEDISNWKIAHEQLKKAIETSREKRRANRKAEKKNKLTADKTPKKTITILQPSTLPANDSDKTTSKIEKKILTTSINNNPISELTLTEWFIKQNLLKNDTLQVALPDAVIDTFKLIEEVKNFLASEKNKEVETRFVGGGVHDLLFKRQGQTKDYDFHIKAGALGKLISGLSQICGTTENGFNCSVSNKPGKEKLVALTHKKTKQKIDMWIDYDFTKPIFTIHDCWADADGIVHISEQARKDLAGNTLRPCDNVLLQTRLINEPELIFFTLKPLLKNPAMKMSEDLSKIMENIQITEQTCERNKEIIQVKIDELSIRFGDTFWNLFIELNLPQKIFNLEIKDVVELKLHLAAYFAPKPSTDNKPKNTASQGGMFGPKNPHRAEKNLKENRGPQAALGQ